MKIMTTEELSRHHDNLSEMLISWLMSNPHDEEKADDMYLTYNTIKDSILQKATTITTTVFLTCHETIGIAAFHWH